MAYILDLVAVPVTTLGKGLAAQSARIRSEAQMGAYVVQDVAQFGEILVAGLALQHLIKAARLGVQIFDLSVAFVF